MDFKPILAKLTRERIRLRAELAKVEHALAAFSHGATPRKTRRKMSAATKKKIARAQKRTWKTRKGA